MNELVGTPALYRENKDLLFGLIEETISEVLPVKVADIYAGFAEVKNLGQGDKPIFRRKVASAKIRAKQFITRVGLAGRYEVFKLGGSESFEIKTSAVGGAAGVIHAVDSATTDCQPNDNVEALRVYMLAAKVEARPVWKPMHKQPVYKNAPAYVNGVSEDIFKVGMCLPAGPYVSDEDVQYIVETIKEAMEL
jgi:hypothetical protein